MAEENRGIIVECRIALTIGKTIRIIGGIIRIIEGTIRIIEGIMPTIEEIMLTIRGTMPITGSHKQEDLDLIGVLKRCKNVKLCVDHFPARSKKHAKAIVLKDVRESKKKYNIDSS